MERIVNCESWRGPLRFYGFMFSALMLTFAFMYVSRNPPAESGESIFVHFLPTICVFGVFVFVNLILPAGTSSYTESVEINPSKLSITQCEALRLWQRATVKHFDFPISAIESLELVFENTDESTNEPHLSLSMRDAPVGCPKNIVLRASEAQILRFIDVADSKSAKS